MPVTPIHLTLSYYAQNFDTLPSTGSVNDQAQRAAACALEVAAAYPGAWHDDTFVEDSIGLDFTLIADGRRTHEYDPFANAGSRADHQRVQEYRSRRDLWAVMPKRFRKVWEFSSRP